MSDQWSFAEFRKNISQADPDFHIVALDKLCAYLSQIDTLKLSPNDLEYLLKLVTLRAEDQEGQEVIAYQKVSSALRAVVLLVSTVPIDALGGYLDQIVQKPFQDACPLRAHYESIFKEILVNSMSLPEEKQVVLKDHLFPVYFNQMNMNSMEKTKSAMDIMTGLTHALGFLFNEDEIKQIHTLLDKFLAPEYLELSSVISQLAVAWSVYVPFEEFSAFVAKCLEHIENAATDPTWAIAFSVISGCVIHNAKAFSQYLNDVINVFYNRVIAVNAENEEDDQDQARIQEAHDSMLCLEALITAFPESFVETANYYCELVFDFMGFGSSIAPSTTDVATDNEAIIGVDLDEDIDEVLLGDDSWKVMKASHVLTQTLIRKYPDTFYASLEAHLPTVLVLIADADQGAKASGLQTLLLIAKTYKTSLAKETVTLWTSKLINELLDEDPLLVALVMPALTTMIKEFGGSVSDKHLRRAVESLVKVIPTLVPETLALLSALISYCTQIKDHGLTLSKILGDILAMNQAVSMCISTIAQLYYYIPTPAKDAMEAFTQLNQKVVDIAMKPSDKQVAAVNALSVYVCLHKDAATAKESLQAIVKCLKQDSCAKQSCNALSLIGCSPSSALLGPFAGDILGQLATYISSSDATLVVRTLWVIFVGLSNNVFKAEQCEHIVAPLSAIVATGDIRCKLLALKIAKFMAPLASVSSKLITDVKKILTEQRLSHKTVVAAAEFICAVKCDVEDLVKFLMQKCSELDKSTLTLDNAAIVANIALAIALVVASNAELNKKMISELEKSILEGKEIEPFKLRIIGEIGARSSLADHVQLVDKIFALIESEDRRIFAAAVESAALVASGSLDKVYGQFKSKATKDTARIAVWLIGINVCLKRLNKQHAQVDLGDLVTYLIQSADYEKETAGSFAECLAKALTIQPTFADQYIENLAKREKASPLTARALAMYLEECDEQQAESIMTRIIGYLDPENPMTTASVLLAYKACLKFSNLQALLVSNIENVVQCLKTSASQFSDIFYGAERRTVDHGRLMRINAIDAIVAFFSVLPEHMDLDHVISVCIEALNDPRVEVRKRVVLFLCQIAELPSTNKALRSESNLGPLVEGLEKLDEKVFSDPSGELIEPFLMFIARFHRILEDAKQTSSVFERLYGRRKNWESMSKIENDARFVIEFHRSIVHDYQARSVGYLLMEKYNPQAVDIFAN